MEGPGRAAMPRALAAALEPLEYAPLLLFRNADAFVLDHEHHVAASRQHDM